MLDVIEKTSWDTFNRINRIATGRDNLQKVIEQETKIRNATSLVDTLFTMPFTTVKHLVQRKIYAENTARNYLNQLSEMGLVEKLSLEGHNFYKNLDLYQILSD